MAGESVGGAAAVCAAAAAAAATACYYCMHQCIMVCRAALHRATTYAYPEVCWGSSLMTRNSARCVCVCTAATPPREAAAAPWLLQLPAVEIQQLL